MSTQPTIQLTVVGLLKQYVPDPPPGPQPGQTISELIAELGIPHELEALVIVNRRQQLKSYVLKPGDVVKLAPLVGGGKRLAHD
jgi:molybdopterin converting factor small subunit